MPDTESMMPTKSKEKKKWAKPKEYAHTPKPVPQPWAIERVTRNTFNIFFDNVGPKWEAWGLLRSDVHHDNPKCDWNLERKHLAEVKERNGFIIDNGDLFCAMQGKYDKRSSKDSIRPEHANGNYLDALVDEAAEFYRPYAKHFAVMGDGNHETGIRKNHETDLTDRLAAKLRAMGSPVQKSGYGGWVRFSYKTTGNKAGAHLLHHYHGSGGGGPVTRGVIDTNRIAVFTPDPEIVLTGHSHDEWMVTITRQRISQRGEVYRDEQVHVRVPGYKDAWADGHGGYEVERRHGPKPIGAAWLRLFYINNAVHFEISRAK